MDKHKLVKIVSAARIAGKLEADAKICYNNDEELLDLIVEEYPQFIAKGTEAFDADENADFPLWEDWIRDVLLSRFGTDAPCSQDKEGHVLIYGDYRFVAEGTGWLHKDGSVSFELNPQIDRETGNTLTDEEIIEDCISGDIHLVDGSIYQLDPAAQFKKVLTYNH